ncbi:MAG TPA: type III polyketide synthase [Pirellulales bacterium]|nr:type III polyketide synthase [Pirellulales bacterium]
MSLTILGMGTALPPHVVSQSEAAELGRLVCCQTEEQASLLRVLYRRSGVKNRHSVLPHRKALDWVAPAGDAASAVDAADRLGPTTRVRMQFYEEHASGLALTAAEAALCAAAIEPAAISHLVTVSCTGFSAPGVDVALIRSLGLAATVERVHVGFMGCHGAINGLRVARGLAAEMPAARVLLVAVELCSLHYCYQWDPAQMVGNAVFADGAAALVAAHGNSTADAWRVLATGSCLLPDSQDAMAWQIGDHGFEMQLSARVPDLIGEHLRPWLTRWLDRQGVALENVGSWAVHPGGPRIVSAVEAALRLTPGATAVSREILAEHGNMSSPTVLFIVDRLRSRRAPRPCVALAFGPGLMAEAALFG